MRLLAIASVLLVFVSTPSLADEPYAITPNGRAETLFDIPARETSDKLAGACMSNSWVVKDQTPSQVLCEAPTTFGQNLLANLTLGNRYSTPPRLYYRFSIVEMTTETRVQANGWMGLQSAFGQDREMDTNLKGFHNNAMDLMMAAGGRPPEGTEFPNHAFIGSSFEIVDEPKQGFKLREVLEQGPFALAGMRDGDVVTKVAGERWKNYADLYDGLHKATGNETYEVEFYRGDERNKTVVSLVYREPIGPIDYSVEPFHQAEAGQQIIVNNEISVADELKKFAELRDSGVITSDEFDAQKALLLGTERLPPENAVGD